MSHDCDTLVIRCVQRSPTQLLKAPEVRLLIFFYLFLLPTFVTIPTGEQDTIRS